MKINDKSKKFIVGVVLVGSVLFATTYKPNNNSASSNLGNSVVKASVTVQDTIFTLDELSKYNGKNGNEAYVAVDGIVYDVTNAKGWKSGVHKNGITAGKDVTAEIDKAPHGKSILKKLNVVGKLK